MNGTTSGRRLQIAPHSAGLLHSKLSMRHLGLPSALARLGAGDLSEAQVEAALADPGGAHPEVSSRRFEAPAHGLWLERVDCGDDS